MVPVILIHEILTLSTAIHLTETKTRTTCSLDSSGTRDKEKCSGNIFNTTLISEL